ncbi:MAG: hypothetical protein JXQ97_11590 [Natronospirillum sp.]
MIGIALIISTLIVRWQPVGNLVYPITERMAKVRDRRPWLGFLLVAALSAALWLAIGHVQTALVALVLMLLFAGRPLSGQRLGDTPEYAERLARSIRRYFVPLPLLALFGLGGVIMLLWLRLGSFPFRQAINRWLNLTTAQLVGFHWGMMKKSKVALQRSLVVGAGQPRSLLNWCVQFITRVQEEFSFAQIWQAFVVIRWQWLAVAVVVRLLFD